ncbi:uncharacterized protein PAC_13609 [Phialocephala subalpina]|uniref:Uncharacterized protein n=1 Tax=Phialocephala subalpina TaxID=576137 RepID=A0A1L7XFA7_9HELO|nr:uncharacterized protein PAC_13609 [Phialocephala subalpina]
MAGRNSNNSKKSVPEKSRPESPSKPIIAATFTRDGRALFVQAVNIFLTGNIKVACEVALKGLRKEYSGKPPTEDDLLVEEFYKALGNQCLDVVTDKAKELLSKDLHPHARSSLESALNLLSALENGSYEDMNNNLNQGIQALKQERKETKITRQKPQVEQENKIPANGDQKGPKAKTTVSMRPEAQTISDRTRRGRKAAENRALAATQTPTTSSGEDAITTDGSEVTEELAKMKMNGGDKEKMKRKRR